MTRVLVLAAGQGTRLRPLTDNTPKSLVPLCGVPMLVRQVKTLNDAGITDIHVATGYRKEKIEALGFETSFNARFASTNMVETLFCALDFLKKSDDDLILAYGDIVYNPENLQALLACEDEITLMIDKQWRDLWSLRLENPLEDAETLMMDAEGYVTELGKKPESYDRIQGQYTGLIKIRGDKIPDVIAFYEGLDRDATYDGKTFDNMYMTSFLQMMIDAGWKAKAAIVKNGWLEVDSVEDLEQYQDMQKQGTLQAFYKLEDIK